LVETRWKKKDLISFLFPLIPEKYKPKFVCGSHDEDLRVFLDVSNLDYVSALEIIKKNVVSSKVLPPSKLYSLKYNTLSFDKGNNNYKIVLAYSKIRSGGMDTEVKEGLVGLLWAAGYTFATRTQGPINDLGDLKHLYKDLRLELKSQRYIKFDNQTINKLHKFLDSPDKKHLKALNDKISVSNLLYKAGYSPGRYIFEKANIYSQIRKSASSLSNLPADKWNPSDVFLVNFKFSFVDILKFNSLESINKLFIEKWGSHNKPILGISLKELVAQGGKAKSFLNRYGNDFNLTKQEQKLSTRTKKDKIRLIRKDAHIFKFKYADDVEYIFEPRGKKKEPNVSMSFASYKILDFLLNLDNPNIFVEIAKYAMGTHDKNINPPFFKIVGHHDDLATVSSFNKYDTIRKIGKIIIIDRESRNGILIKMNLKIGEKVKPIILNIRSLGYTQSTIEIERQF